MADAATVSVLLQAKDNASKEFKNVESNMGKMVQGIQQHRRAIGMAMTAMGAAITGAAALSIKSAFDQEKGIRQLDTALQKVGTSYEQQKAQIEAVVAAQQNKTNFGDEEQRDALRELILVSGNYDDAMKALVPTMELAAGKEMDLGAAATLVARAISGEESALNRYGVSVEKGADSTEVLAAIMEKFAGQAEAAADPMTQLKNRVGDLFQAFGQALLPVLETMVPMIESMVKRMIEWTEAHPNLTKVLAIVAASLGAIMLVLGPMLLILPQLFMGMKIFAGGIRLVTAAMAANPVGILLVALTTLAMVALPLVMKHWDKIWTGIKKLTETVVNFVIGLLNKLTLIWRKQFELIAEAVAKLLDMGSKLPFVGDKFSDAADAIRGFSDKLEEGIPKIDITSNKQEELQDTMQATASVTEDVGRAIAGEQTKIAESAHEMASDIDMSYGSFEDSVTSAQGIVVQSLDEIVKAQEDAENKLDTSLASLRERLDETNVKWRESGLSMEDLVKRWAISTGQSINDVLDDWDVLNLDTTNTKEMLAAFYEFTGQSAFDWKDRTVKATEEVSGGYRTLKSNVDSISSGLHESLVGTAATTLSIASGIHETISGLHAAAARPLPVPRMGGHPGGGQHSGTSGIHVTAPGFDATKVAAGEALASLKGQTNRAAGAAGKTQFTGFAAGTTFAQIEEALGLANGGIVKQPTLAMIGERGPEAVIPLNKSNGMGQTNNFHFHGSVYGVEDLKEAVVEAVRDHAISGGFSGVFAEA